MARSYKGYYGWLLTTLSVFESLLSRHRGFDRQGVCAGLKIQIREIVTPGPHFQNKTHSALVQLARMSASMLKVEMSQFF